MQAGCRAVVSDIRRNNAFTGGGVQRICIAALLDVATFVHYTQKFGSVFCHLGANILFWWVYRI